MLNLCFYVLAIFVELEKIIFTGLRNFFDVIIDNLSTTKSCLVKLFLIIINKFSINYSHIDSRLSYPNVFKSR
jgi:hypothetical protein